MSGIQPPNLNPLSYRHDVVTLLQQLLTSVDHQFSVPSAGITLGHTAAHYSGDIAKMEGLSRALWGLFPLLAGGDDSPFLAKYIQAIKLGTNPDSEHYWGTTDAYDQRLVEMAVYGMGLALLQDRLTAHFNTTELAHLHRWLDQISTAIMPDSNWNYFAIMVQLGFNRAGLPWDMAVINQRFDQMEAYYLGNGWYSDGIGRPKDYYISMAFHFYGLFYAKLMADTDPVRCAELNSRATLFARDFIYMSSANGASIPFGRSLTYRFAQVAFWSAVAYSELDIIELGVLKGIILRHLRWWQEQPILDNSGILTIGYAYPNLIMAEDYNSPGSPYWALKTCLILALPASHPFWDAAEQPLPPLKSHHLIKEADQLIVHPHHSDHVYLLTAGQLELNNYVNTEAKYTKFAYSSHYGFTVERGRYGLKHAACDSMLLLASDDGYFRGRRACDAVISTDRYIYSRWMPWSDVIISTWLIPCGQWHLRVHHINTGRELKSAEGGFAINTPLHESRIDELARQSQLKASKGTSLIIDHSPLAIRQPDSLITPPNSSIMFAECAAIPLLTGQLSSGEHWLCSAVAAAPDDTITEELKVDVQIKGQQLVITFADTHLTLAI